MRCPALTCRFVALRQEKLRSRGFWAKTEKLGMFYSGYNHNGTFFVIFIMYAVWFSVVGEIGCPRL